MLQTQNTGQRVRNWYSFDPLTMNCVAWQSSEILLSIRTQIHTVTYKALFLFVHLFVNQIKNQSRPFKQYSNPGFFQLQQVQQLEKTDKRFSIASSIPMGLARRKMV